MKSWCEDIQKIRDSRSCWRCVERKEMYESNPLRCKIVNMPRYRLFSLYRGNHTPESFGYYNRRLKAFRKLEGEEDENDRTVHD